MIKKVLKKQNNAKNCFVCGVKNEFGLNSRFYELEDETVACTLTAKKIHQSFPNRVHGGVITAMLDETIGRAINIFEPDTWAVTGELNVKFKKPVPYDVPLIVIGRIDKNGRKIFTGTGEIILPNGEVAAIASATYVKLELSEITDFEANNDSWECYLLDDDLKEIDIPEKRDFNLN